MNEIKKEYKWAKRIGLIILFSCAISAAYFAGAMAWAKATTTDCTNLSTGNYSMGYIQGIADLILEAYTKGIVKIPINSTNYVALVPYGG
jgi:hypothetical protein